jgi:hypothetical protein
LEQLISAFPELKSEQSYFVHTPLSTEERDIYNKYKQNISVEDFAKLTAQEKNQYLDLITESLPEEFFKLLPNELKNKYINFGFGLTEEEYKEIENDKSLVKNFTRVINKKMEMLIKTYDIGIDNFTSVELKDIVNNSYSDKFPYYKEFMDKISTNSHYSYWLAKYFDIDKIPPEIINSIAKNSYYSYYFAIRFELDKIHPEIINGIAQNDYYAYEFAKYLKFKSIPQPIINSIVLSDQYSYEFAKHFNFEKDKIPDPIWNTYIKSKKE